ncbi:MAG TPA: PIN domain-containing protein [Acidimicrobiales bacterium]
MALTHLVDTSVLARAGTPGVQTVLSGHLRSGSAARAGISDLEVGFSARNAAEWDALTAAVATFVLIETTDAHVRRARQVQRRLAERGLRGRKVPDLLVAAAAEDHGFVVLHYDVDFDLIREVTGQPTEWVVPAGSID